MCMQIFITVLFFVFLSLHSQQEILDASSTVVHTLRSREGKQNQRIWLQRYFTQAPGPETVFCQEKHRFTSFQKKISDEQEIKASFTKIQMDLDRSVSLYVTKHNVLSETLAF